MQDYTDKELEEMIRTAGGDLEKLQSEGDKGSGEMPKQGLTAPKEGKVSPTQIMSEVKAQGLSIPKAAIGKFLVCVLKGIWTQPLPVAVANCAKSFGSGSNG